MFAPCPLWHGEGNDPWQGRSWQERPWQFFGLTQTCRRLREEFRPLWMGRLNVRLTCMDIDDFLFDFIPDTHTTHAVANIELLWSINYRICFDFTLHLLRRANGVRTTFGSSPRIFMTRKTLRFTSPASVVSRTLLQQRAGTRLRDPTQTVTPNSKTLQNG